MMRAVVALLVLAGAAHGAQPTGGRGSFLETEANPMEKVPVVGDQFKVNPVSTSMKCVISLTIQYMVIYTALAVCRTLCHVLGNSPKDWEKFTDPLEQAVNTVAFAPMLAVLFIGCRMRVTWLTQGKGNPPEYVQAAMYCATYSVLAMTLCVVVIPILMGTPLKADKETGQLDEDAKPFDSSSTFGWIAATCFTVLKYLILLGLYVGALVVVYGIINFVPPKGIWPGDRIPPVSPAVQCTMILSCQFFVVYGLIQVSATCKQFGANFFGDTFDKAMKTATLSMFFAPMLAVLFIGARMRALQMDPVNGAPQRWAQNCFFMCTYALLVQTILTIAIPVVLGGTAKKVEPTEGRPYVTEGEIEYEISSMGSGVATVLSIIKYIILIGIYVGFSCVIYSVLTIEHPQGPQYTPPVSVTMQCVINLTVQFFFVYFMLWVCNTVREFLGFANGWMITLLSDTMDSAKGTINYCPMLAILFVGTRMRALMITNNRGAPQGWVQDGMYMATWAVLIQFLMVIFVGLTTAGPVPIDEDGTPKWEPTHPILTYVALGLKWITFIFLYAGIIAVITGVYTMTPQTAN